MSIENATAFKNILDQDAGLRGEVLETHRTGGMTAVCEMAASMGYSFAPADAKATLAPAGGELSDLELEAVAGGKSQTTGPNWTAIMHNVKTYLRDNPGFPLPVRTR